jgi:alkaline ceramidase TOD1/glycosyltransferase MUCI70-like protein
MMLVYSAIYGGYDIPKPPRSHPDVSEWRLYTDDPAIDAPGWSVVVEPRTGSARMSAKFRKCYPPEGVDRSLYLDGTIQLHDQALLDTATQALEMGDWAMYPHPERDNIRDEAEFSVPWYKYANQPLREQVEHYLKERPVAGLWAGGIIARRHTPTVLAASAAWYGECLRWSDQDQLSLPFILAKYDIKVSPITGGWREHFSIIEHTRPRE